MPTPYKVWKTRSPAPQETKPFHADWLEPIRFIARACTGGETVENGQAQTACDYCTAGRCRELQACGEAQ